MQHRAGIFLFITAIFAFGLTGLFDSYAISVTPAPLQTTQVKQQTTATSPGINYQSTSSLTTGGQLVTGKTEKGEKIQLEPELLSEVKKANQKDTIVSLVTGKGTIEIKLYTEESPLTAGNFKDLVEKRFYDGLTFHRIIPGFVIQGGCPNGTGTGSYIDPKTKQARYIKHEKNNLHHDKAGVVAMARTSDPDSASSQFFIDLAPQPALDAGGVDPYGYVIFGQVVSGMDVVNKIVQDNLPPSPGSDGTSNPVKIKSASVL